MTGKATNKSPHRKPCPCGSDGSGSCSRVPFAFGSRDIDWSKVGCHAADAARLGSRKSKSIVGTGGVPIEMADKLRAFERENHELPQANKILRKASAYCDGGAQPPVQAMIAFIDDHREAHGSSRSARFCRPPLEILSPKPSTVSKPEVIHQRGKCRNFEAVEFATLKMVDWFNNRRLLELIAEQRDYAMLEQPAMAA